MAVCGPVHHQNASLIARRRQLLSVPREVQCSMGGSYILKRGQMRWDGKSGGGMMGKGTGEVFVVIVKHIHYIICVPVEIYTSL